MESGIGIVPVVPVVPVVGVLCVDIAEKLSENFGLDWYCYIAASYIKYLDGAGAHVIPIWIGRERHYYEEIMRQVNGILLPGGAVFVNESDTRDHPEFTSDCVGSARHIYELAMEINVAGGYFPIWGTCLGFQLMLINAAGSIDVRTDCPSINRPMPIQLTSDYKSSKLLMNLNTEKAQQMGITPFACHQHRYCIREENFLRCGLAQHWRVLATSADRNGHKFVTLVEHRDYPLYGSQFHPERAAYEKLLMQDDLYADAHSQNAIELTQFFANTFVDSCRKNRNRFVSNAAIQRHLIWNWEPKSTPKSNWLQCYLFKKGDDYPAE